MLETPCWRQQANTLEMPWGHSKQTTRGARVPSPPAPGLGLPVQALMQGTWPSDDSSPVLWEIPAGAEWSTHMWLPSTLPKLQIREPIVMFSKLLNLGVVCYADLDTGTNPYLPGRLQTYEQMYKDLSLSISHEKSRSRQTKNLFPGWYLVCNYARFLASPLWFSAIYRLSEIVMYLLPLSLETVNKWTDEQIINRERWITSEKAVITFFPHLFLLVGG